MQARCRSGKGSDAGSQPQGSRLRRGILLQLAALSRRVCAAAVALLVGAFAGSGLLPTITEADEAGARPIERSGVAHAPRRPWRTPAGTQWIGLKGQLETENWAGYVAPGQAPFTSVVGRWVVPSVAYAAGNSFPEEASSLWIGIGGTDGGEDLIQLGTEQDVSSSGAATYYAWYEMLPADEVSLPQQYPVSPGDVMSASLQCVASCSAGAAQTWTLSIADYTAGWSWTSNVAYNSSLSSAEWILEATASGTGAVQHLPDFGSAVFFADLVNGASPGLTLAQAQQLIDPHGGATGNPSSPVDGSAFQICWGSGGNLTPCSLPPVTLAAAVLPSSRSVELGNTATAFATLINSGAGAVTGCAIAPITPVSASFTYQTTNPATNAVTGQPNTPVDLLAGASQSFVIALSPTASFGPSDVALGFVCSSLVGPLIYPGVNTLLFSSSSTPVPDIVALAATASDDGILHLPGASGANAFAVATVNLGAAAAITASANTGTASLPLVLSICQTNPMTGQCLGAAASSASAAIAANATPTFAIFAAATNSVPLVPQTNRIFVEFSDAGGAVRGSTSVAVETQ
jgi:Peptidase A4 family